jgi:uncharacterized protein
MQEPERYEMSTKVIKVVEGLPTNVGEKVQSSVVSTRKESVWKKLLWGFAGLVGWWLVYGKLAAFSEWVTLGLLKLSPSSRLGTATAFFLYDTPKVLMLLILVVFGVGIVRSYFSPERTRSLLAGRSEFLGNILASALGIVTPFCSCSAVPLFIGFVTAGVPLGVTFSFLVAAPMINEVALVLLWGLLGWKVAVIYVATGLAIAITSGMVIGWLRMEKYVADWVSALPSATMAAWEERMNWDDRIRFGRDAVAEIVGKVWPYVIGGIAVGAGIHGYVPEDFMASIMGREAWWSVPLAVLIGIPIYSNAAGIIPIVEALLEKGAALGTVLAFMMAVIGLSLPETIILRNVLKPRLIAAFIGVVGLGIMAVGYIFNFLF